VWASRAFTGEWTDPDVLIPERYRVPKAAVVRTEAMRKRDTRAGLALLGRFLGDKDPLG
jgi:hypothetical protein